MNRYAQAGVVMAFAVVAACGAPAPLPAAVPPPVTTTAAPAASPTPPASATPPTTTRRPHPSPADTGAGCGQRAVTAGRFNAACGEYQGYLDPGTAAGRGPTSGELQHRYGCAHGLIPKSEC